VFHHKIYVQSGNQNVAQHTQTGSGQLNDDVTGVAHVVGGTGDDHAAKNRGHKAQGQQDHVTLAEEIFEKSNDMAHCVASFIQFIIALILWIVNPFSHTSADLP
jgi:hypothetical protein